jgi:hypothetical protein
MYKMLYNFIEHHGGVQPTKGLPLMKLLWIIVGIVAVMLVLGQFMFILTKIGTIVLVVVVVCALGYFLSTRNKSKTPPS